MSTGRGLGARAALGSLVAAAVLAGMSALPATAAAAGCGNARANPDEVSLAKLRSATLCLVNRQRARRDLDRLRHHRKLRRAAQGHTRQMVARGFFSHYGPKGSSATDRIRETGYLRGSDSWATGENIGWGAGSRATPKAMVRAWMRSSGHRRNILSAQFSDVGIGVARGAPEGRWPRSATYTTDFGRR